MKNILLIHNPTAGDAELGKEELLTKLRSNGREITYVSTDDEGWEDFSLDEKDLIVLCGGDGTVHKLVKVLLNRKKDERQIPIYLVPSGTANNIATTLNLKTPRKFEFQKYLENIQLFDFGKISGLEDFEFFIEGIGFGFFPELIRQMKEADEIPDETGSEKLQRTLRLCRDIVMQLDPIQVIVDADGIHIDDKFLLAEVLNTKHIGPNLKLAPLASPGDGLMDLILISPDDRHLLLEYIDSLLSKRSEESDVNKFVKVIKVKKVKMKGNTTIMHVDDTILTGEKDFNFTLKVEKGEFRFL